MKYLSRFNSFLEKIGEKISSFESFQISTSGWVGYKELEEEFNDLEDYFIDFFDESNQKWDIKLSRYFENSLRLIFVKKDHGTDHRFEDVHKTLIKRNPMDILISHCMDRLASSKGLRVGHKKKLWRYEKHIGYSCVLMGYSKISEKVGEKEISSIESYINGMSKSISDKLFFLDKIDTDLIVDFGCADGTILSEIQKRRPNIKLIGYDIDEEMISRAKSKNSKILFTSSWDKVISEISTSKSPTLNLSSVIHEVYSYSTSKVIKDFWENKVFGSGFKWITIRDMIPSTEISRKKTKEFENDVKKVKELSDTKYLKSFEDKWGIIDDNYRTFTHYLLKYRFKENWDREVLENYLPVGLETLKKKITTNYKITHEDSFILPFLKKTIKEDFDIELKSSTHTKMIIQRKSE